MPHATAYSLTKSALVTQLNTRAGLAGVAVSYQEPVKAEDVTGQAGAREAVFCGRAEGTLDNVILCASHLRFDEEFTLDLVIQVEHQPRADDQEAGQHVADQRVEELLYEVHAEIASQRDWDMAELGLDVFDYYQITPVSQVWVTGFLPAGSGHGARCELGLLIQARRGFD